MQRIIPSSRSQGVLATALGLCLIVLTGGGLAWGIAQAQTSSPTIYACVGPSGSVRIVSEGTACKNNETATSWSQQGPAGSPGADGAQGEPGPEGPKGDTGDVDVTVHLEEDGAGDPAAPVNMFLQLDGVPGEATDDEYKDQIEIVAWSWGMSNSGSSHVGGGIGSGKVNVQDISLTKFIDKASPKLMKAAATGQHIPRATLRVRHQADDGQGVTYMVIEMNDLLVTAISTGGSNGQDRLTENITLNFASFKVTYTEQKADGTTAPHSVEFNIKENR